MLSTWLQRLYVLDPRTIYVYVKKSTFRSLYDDPSKSAQDLEKHVGWSYQSEGQLSSRSVRQWVCKSVFYPVLVPPTLTQQLPFPSICLSVCLSLPLSFSNLYAYTFPLQTHTRIHQLLRAPFSNHRVMHKRVPICPMIFWMTCNKKKSNTSIRLKSFITECRVLTAISKDSVNPFRNKPRFLRVCKRSLLKTLWEKEKLLISTHLENFLLFSSN